MHGFVATVPSMETKQRCLVLDILDGQTVTSVLEAAYNERKTELHYVAIIMRLPVTYQIPDKTSCLLVNSKDRWDRRVGSLMGNPRKSYTFRRAGRFPVYFLYSRNFRHKISGNANPRGICVGINESVLAGLQAEELNQLIMDGRAALPMIRGYFYEAPSRRELITYFLRAGNIQRSVSALDAIFFWLLPHLRNCRAILTDTWSIGSTALHIGRRLQVYRGDRKAICPVELLHGYVATSKEATDRADRQLHRLCQILSLKKSQTDGVILFLMSVVNSGELHNQVLKLLTDSVAEMDMTKITKFVALFRVGIGAPELPHLLDCNDYSRIERADPATINRSKVIPVDPSTLFPSYSIDIKIKIEDHKDPAGKKPWVEADVFLKRYPAVMRVHRNDDSTGEKVHHPVWIDTQKLIEDETFAKRLVEVLATLQPRPTLIITPSHEAGVALGALILQKFGAEGASMTLRSHSDLDLTEGEKLHAELRSIRKKGAILVADDALVSGNRSTAYQRSLRNIGYKGKIHWLFAVARPASDVTLEARRLALVFRRGFEKQDHHTCNWIEKILLPDSHQHCPWCEELKQLEEGPIADTPEGGPKQASWLHRDDIDERIKFLRSGTATGLDRNLFAIAGSEKRLFFGETSFFGPTSLPDVAIYSAIASTIQKIRETGSGGPGLGSTRVPVAYILDWEDYLQHKWSDSLLRAAILRACTPEELMCASATEEAKRMKAAKKLINALKSTHHDIAAELILAAHCGKFPGLPLDSQELAHRLETLCPQRREALSAAQ